MCASSKRRTARGDTIHQLPGRALLLRKKIDEVYIIKETNYRGDNDTPFESTVFRRRISKFFIIFVHLSFILIFSGQNRIYHVDEGSVELVRLGLHQRPNPDIF